jgi:hypothetical protein
MNSGEREVGRYAVANFPESCSDERVKDEQTNWIGFKAL